MTGRNRTVALGFAFASTLLLLAQASGIMGDTLLAFGPLLLVLVPLLAGRFVGEDRIVRIIKRIHAARRRRVAPQVPPLGFSSFRARPRGGRLIALSLATRPPPAPSFTA